MKSSESISFVMAGYNEHDNVREAIALVQKTLEDRFDDYEIVLINDGSTDDTLQLMQECAEGNPRIKVIDNLINLNYGASVLRGLKAASKKWVVYDAFDLEMNPETFADTFMELPDDVDVVVYQRETYEAVGWRKFASLLNRSLLNILFPLLMRGTPVLNHTQLFRRSVVEQIMPQSRSPIFFSPEMIFRAKLQKLNWKNVVIPFFSIDGVRPGAFGHFYDIFWALQDIFRFRFALWGGKVKRK